MPPRLNAAASPLAQRIFDLTLAVSADSLSWGSTEGLGPDFRTLRGQRSKGDIANMSWLRMDAHTATHLDAPSHFVQVNWGLLLVATPPLSTPCLHSATARCSISRGCRPGRCPDALTLCNFHCFSPHSQPMPYCARQEAFDSGKGVESLSLAMLNGASCRSWTPSLCCQRKACHQCRDAFRGC